MDVRSAYLEAIQAIPGKTPQQKYKELNLIAGRIASKSKADGRSSAAEEEEEEEAAAAVVPAALLPLVKVEIANVLRRNEGIVEALVSEDSAVVARALRAKWFFGGANREATNVEFFEKRLLSRVSLDTRAKLLKKLARAFANSAESAESARQFYVRIAETYGRTEAESLLLGCSESFVRDVAVRGRVVLSVRVLRRLLTRYPDTAVGYLKLSKPIEGGRSRNVFRIDIHRYKSLLPRLIKNKVDAFVELIETHDSSLGLKLSNKATESFLKNQVEAVTRKPRLYAAMMPLKVIAAKLTKAQYNGMLAKLLPKRVEDFDYREIKEYLELCPERERAGLLIESYRAVYRSNLLENGRAMRPELVAALPAEERARQARIKLAEEPDWRENRWDTAMAWRCYLPLEETIPSIVDEISKSSSLEDRAALLSQLLYSCKLNDEDEDEKKEALLRVLEYLTTRHRNEQPVVIFRALDSLLSYFEPLGASLGPAHWAVLYDFIRFLRAKGLFSSSSASPDILGAAVHSSLARGLPINDFVEAIVEMFVEGRCRSLSLIPKQPDYDRRCIDACLTRLPLKYPRDERAWAKRAFASTLLRTLETVYEFNARTKVKGTNRRTVERLSIKDYPWIAEGVERLVKNESGESNDWERNAIIGHLEANEKELCEAWRRESNAIAKVESGEALIVLRADPERILERWEEYLDATRSSVRRSVDARRFVKLSRWHQDLPIKFIASCSRCVSGPDLDERSSSLIVLGILLEGAAYERIVEPLLPTVGARVDAAGAGDGKYPDYAGIRAVSRALGLTDPPVSLGLALTLCRGDWIDLGLASLTSLSRRTDVEAVKKFAKILIGDRVSVKKHGIRTFCLAATIEERRELLSELWRTEKHRSIRAVVFDKIHKLFAKEAATPESWTTMRECITNLRGDDDDEEILGKLVNLGPIPNEYIADYVRELFGALEKLGENEFAPGRRSRYVVELLGGIDGPTTNLLPETFSMELVRKYFCNPSADLETSNAGRRYTVRSYLESAEERLESRLKALQGLYEEALRKEWDVRHREHSTFYPINYQASAFVSDAVYDEDLDENKKEILEAIRESFLAVLKPEQDIVAYVLLNYGIALDGLVDHDEIAIKLREILPELIKTVSPELILELGEITSEYIKGTSSNSEERDKLTYRVIETLHRSDSRYLAILAAKLVFRSDDRRLHPRYNRIVDALRRSPYPAVLALIHRHCNGCSYSH